MSERYDNRGKFSDRIEKGTVSAMLDVFLNAARQLLAWFDAPKFFSLTAFIVSLLSVYFTWLGRRLAVAQERRRTPQLVPFQLDSFYRRTSKGRTYFFNINLSNRSDTNNSVSVCEMKLVYTKDEAEMTARIFASSSDHSDTDAQRSRLVVPAAVNAHNAISGWLYFDVPNSVLQGTNIESYQIDFVDTHGITVSLSPSFLREDRDGRR